MIGELSIRHIVETLPDSFSQRAALLRDMLVIIPQDHPGRARLAQLLTFLEMHEELQQQFPFSIPPTPPQP